MIQDKSLAQFLCLLLFLMNIASHLHAQIEQKDLFEMTIEELMNVKISTAGKKPEKVNDIPASVVIITRDDIKKYVIHQNLRDPQKKPT